MTGDALLSALRTFGPGGATVQQLRAALNTSGEDIDIGLKVLRESNQVVMLGRHVIIPPDYLPRTRLDSPEVARYHKANPHDHSISHPLRETLTLRKRPAGGRKEAQVDAA